MYKAIVAMTMTLAAAEAWAEPPKSHPVDVGPGRVAWFDITTSNLQQSKAFYGNLFGWEFRPVKGTDLAVEVVAGGMSIGDLRVAAAPGTPTQGAAAWPRGRGTGATASQLIASVGRTWRVEW